MKNASPLYALLHKLVLSISTNLKMSSQQTPEQKDADTRRFVIRAFSVALVVILGLFGYSIVYTEQPLFNEAPADKAIFAILTLVIGQILTILANYISGSRTPMPPSPSFNPCQPIGMTPQLGYSSMNSPMNSAVNTAMNSAMNNPMSGYSIDPGQAWTPPPPPKTPPHHLEDDDEREALAMARHTTKGQ